MRYLLLIVPFLLVLGCVLPARAQVAAPDATRWLGTDGVRFTFESGDIDSVFQLTRPDGADVINGSSTDFSRVDETTHPATGLPIWRFHGNNALSASNNYFAQTATDESTACIWVKIAAGKSFTLGVVNGDVVVDTQNFVNTAYIFSVGTTVSPTAAFIRLIGSGWSGWNSIFTRAAEPEFKLACVVAEDWTSTTGVKFYLNGSLVTTTSQNNLLANPRNYSNFRIGASTYNFTGGEGDFQVLGGAVGPMFTKHALTGTEILSMFREQSAYLAQTPQPTLTTSGVTDTSARLNLSRTSTAWWYRHNTPPGGICTAVRAGVTSVVLSQLDISTEYIFAAYSDATCMTVIDEAPAFTTLAEPPPVPPTAVPPVVVPAAPTPTPTPVPAPLVVFTPPTLGDYELISRGGSSLTGTLDNSFLSNLPFRELFETSASEAGLPAQAFWWFIVSAITVAIGMTFHRFNSFFAIIGVGVLLLVGAVMGLYPVWATATTMILTLAIGVGFRFTRQGEY